MSRHRMEEILARRTQAKRTVASSSGGQEMSAKAVKESLLRPSVPSSSHSSSSGARQRLEDIKYRQDQRTDRIERSDRNDRSERSERSEYHRAEEKQPEPPKVKEVTQSMSKISFGDTSPNYDDDDDDMLLVGQPKQQERPSSPQPIDMKSSSRDEEDEYEEELNESDSERTQSEYSEEEEEEEQEQPQKRRGRPPGSKNRNQLDRLERSTDKDGGDTKGIPRASIIRLVKTLGFQSISKDLIDACVEVIENLIEETKVENKTLNYNDIHAIILRDFKNAENELPEETQISAPAFTRFVSPILQKSNCGLKRDAFFLFHLYCEAYLLKMLKAAEVIALSGKRTRVQGSDLTVAYHVYNM